jgi:hypothetical protein
MDEKNPEKNLNMMGAIRKDLFLVAEDEIDR